MQTPFRRRLAGLLVGAGLAAAPAAAQPVLEVRIDNVVQSSGAERSLSSEVGESAPLIVVLRNVGNQDLRFGNTPVLLDPNRPPWSIIQPPLETGNELSPNGSTAFRIDFAPTVPAGPAEATLSIPTNAAGSPFTLHVTGTARFPVLEVRADNVVIASGTELALPPTEVGDLTQQVVVVRNIGNADLLFESPPVVKDPGSDASFELIQPPLETGDKLSPNGSTAFLARFTPEIATAEPLLAEVAIPTNAAGSPFVLRFSSGVLFSALEVRVDGALRSSGDDVLLSALPGEADSISVALRNAGTQSLAFDAAPALVGDTQGLLTLDAPALGELAPGAEAELLVHFSPSSPLEAPVAAELRISVQGAAGFALDLVGSTPPAGCGNGFQEEGETCDGDDLGEGAACSEPAAASFPGAGERDGVLRCQADCLGFDASGCREICGNCADDDGDGLVDFEDPDCCGGAPAALALRKVRIRPLGAESKLQLDAEAALGLELVPATRDVFLQLRGAGEAGAFCVRVPAAALAEKRGKLGLAQPGEGGLGKLSLKTKKTGATRLQTAGKRLPFATPAPDELSFALGLHEPGAPPDAARCAAATETLRTNGKGVRRYP